MRLGKQILLTLGLLALAGAGWAVVSPAGRPWLEAAGLGGLSRAPVQAEEDRAGHARGPVEVIVRAAVLQDTAHAVAAIGDGRAVRSVTLTPEAAGRVKAIRVSPGEPVAEGQVVIELDDDLARIARDRAELMVADTTATAERLGRLRRSGAVSDQEQAAALLAQRTAELAQQEAAVDLERRSVRAPIAGHVGLIAPEVGDQVTTATEITRIDDRSSILVEFRLPERFAARVRPGDPLTATVLSGEAMPLEGRIRAVDNRVDAASRSFRLQAEIANADDRLRSGMAFSIAMRFPGPARIAVDPLSVQWNAAGAYVWAVREGRAVSVPVRVLQREAGLVMVEGALAPGEPVVVQGLQGLRPGTPVLIAEKVEPTTAAAGAGTGGPVAANEL